MSASIDVIDIPRLRELLAQIGELINFKQGDTSDSVLPYVRWFNPSEQQIASSDLATLFLAKECYRFRRKRSDFLPAELFADPCWDILLELYVLRREGRRASVKSVCIASGVPTTTALRWIGILVKEGLLERTNDQFDQRVRWITLSDHGFEVMHKFMLSGVTSGAGSLDESFQTSNLIQAPRSDQ